MKLFSSATSLLPLLLFKKYCFTYFQFRFLSVPSAETDNNILTSTKTVSFHIPYTFTSTLIILRYIMPVVDKALTSKNLDA